MDYVRRLDDIRAGDAGAFGENAADLGEMTRAGLPVPPGFCLGAEAYRVFIAGEYVDKTIRGILAGLQVHDPEDLEVRTEQVRNFLNAQQVPALIAQEVLQGYYELSVDLGSSVAPIPVAVRSSPTAGALAGSSWSGLPETHLNVSGEADLLERVKRCWGSLWTARAVADRVKQGMDRGQVGLAVIVQAMIQAETSGILFSASPFTGSREEAVIIASWGLSEAILSGLAIADTFTVRKSDGAILARGIASKDRMVECEREGGTIEREVDPERRCIPAVSGAQIAELVPLSRQIEKLCGAPREIEWAYARGRVYILQTHTSRRHWQLLSRRGNGQFSKLSYDAPVERTI